MKRNRKVLRVNKKDDELVQRCGGHTTLATLLEKRTVAPIKQPFTLVQCRTERFPKKPGPTVWQRATEKKRGKSTRPKCRQKEKPVLEEKKIQESGFPPKVILMSLGTRVAKITNLSKTQTVKRSGGKRNPSVVLNKGGS